MTAPTLRFGAEAMTYSRPEAVMYASQSPMTYMLPVPVSVPVAEAKKPSITDDPEWLRRLRLERGWSMRRLTHEIRRVALAGGVQLPEEDSLMRMCRLWQNNGRKPSDFYMEFLSRLFDLPGTDGAKTPTGMGTLARPAAS